MSFAATIGVLTAALTVGALVWDPMRAGGAAAVVALLASAMLLLSLGFFWIWCQYLYWQFRDPGWITADDRRVVVHCPAVLKEDLVLSVDEISAVSVGVAALRSGVPSKTIGAQQRLRSPASDCRVSRAYRSASC
jgi:hypothetical protein